MRYKHYDIEGSKVIGVNGQVVKSFNTEKQAKSWIDKEWKLSQDFINLKDDWKAWYIGDESWNIAHGGETIAKVKITTETKTVEDMTGMKKYRVIRKQKLQVTTRVSWNAEVTINEVFIENGGWKAAIKNMMKSLKDGNIWYFVRTQLEDNCRKLNIPEWNIIDAYDSDRRKHCYNLYKMVSQ
jgi:hypothetical protein